MQERPDLVINTGPIISLAAARHLELLPKLFGRVIVPAEVAGEIEAGGLTQFARNEFRAASWLDRRSEPTVLTPFLQATLDPGEAAVIALATTEKIAHVAIDESLGRRMARLHGLTLTGSLGILIRAKREGFPVVLKTAIENMRRQEVWISKSLEQECLRMVQE